MRCNLLVAEATNDEAVLPERVPTAPPMPWPGHHPPTLTRGGPTKTDSGQIIRCYGVWQRRLDPNLGQPPIHCGQLGPKHEFVGER